MKVLDLQCGQCHVFEGWFGSEDDFQNQLTHRLITCPMCGDVSVIKKLSAPRLNLSTTRDGCDTPGHSVRSSIDLDESMASSTTSTECLNGQEVTNLDSTDLQSTLLKMIRHVVASTEDVGDRFPEEARKMHYGEVEARSIRGHATPQETEELNNEGIAVVSLPLPDAFKKPLH